MPPRLFCALFLELPTSLNIWPCLARLQQKLTEMTQIEQRPGFGKSRKAKPALLQESGGWDAAQGGSNRYR